MWVPGNLEPLQHLHLGSQNKINFSNLFHICFLNQPGCRYTIASRRFLQSILLVRGCQNGLPPVRISNSRTAFPTRLSILQVALPYFFEYHIPSYFPFHFNLEEQIYFLFGWLVFTPSYFHSSELLWLLTKVVAALKEAWRTLFAGEGKKSESVYRISNNAWVIW